MGCFLACFGSSKDRKRRAVRDHKVLLRDQRHGSQNPFQPTVPSEQHIPNICAITIKPIPELQNKLEEQLSLTPKKKVSFDTNVKTYEPIPVSGSTELSPGIDKEIQKTKEDSSEKSSSWHSISEDDSIISSVGSYPPNNRYQNCRESDDEAEEFDCEDNYLDDEDEELEDNVDYDEDESSRFLGHEVWSESIPTASMESRAENSSARALMEEVDSSPTICHSPLEEGKRIGYNPNARDRSVYVHPVLNPVENLTQWKALKLRGTPPLKPQKENFMAELEVPRSSFSSDPTLKNSSRSCKSKSDKSKNQTQDITVDASLSNWLVSSEATPTNKSSIGHESIASERNMSQGSNSVMSFEDRPILGALTVEELKQFSAKSSPRKSPSRSPDEMPIIGTVGTYWKQTDTDNDPGSVSSYKGIPNTTSKYREDKRVNWHSTPFETRLERALNRHAAEV